MLGYDISSAQECFDVQRGVSSNKTLTQNVSGLYILDPNQ